MIGLIDVYPYRYVKGAHQFLLLNRSDDKQYAGQWRMVGGKVSPGEKAWEAGLRELKEETGTVPEVYWTVPSLNHFYDHETDQIKLIPAFAAELHPNAEIILNQEHSKWQWVVYETAQNFIQWPEQLRIINLIYTILTSRELIDDWKILS